VRASFLEAPKVFSILLSFTEYANPPFGAKD